MRNPGVSLRAFCAGAQTPEFTDAAKIDDDPLSPKNVVENALRPMAEKLRVHIACAMEKCSAKLEDLRNRATEDAANSSLEVDLWALWDNLLDSVEYEVKSNYKVVSDIALANPDYNRNDDPFSWAKQWVREQISDALAFSQSLYPQLPELELGWSLEGQLLPVFQELFGNEETSESLLTDLWDGIDEIFDGMESSARLRLALLGGKRSPNSVLGAPSSAPLQAPLTTAPAPTPSPSASRCNWYKEEGGVWHISLPPNPDKSLHVKDSIGMAYIQAVLRASPKELSPTQVQALAGNNIPSEAAFLDESQRFSDSDHFEVPEYAIEKEGLRKFHDTLEMIVRELEELGDSDPARVEELKEQRENIQERLKAVMGRGGRSRKLSSPQTRSYDTVRRGIKRAIDDISECDAVAGKFMEIHIRRTGWRFSYTGAEVAWKLSK